MIDSVESIVKRNLVDFLAWRYPNAVISHRSAHELQPTENGDFFISYNFRKLVMQNMEFVDRIEENERLGKALDKKYLLVGVCKWTTTEDCDRLLNELKS